MRIASLISSLALAACASAGTAGPGGAPISQTVSVVGPTSGTNITMAGSDASSTQALAFSVDQVWRALPAAFDSLGVPVRTLDPVAHRIGNEGFALRRRLKIGPLSHFIDCGTTQFGPNADDYDVRLSVLADVRPAAAGGSTLTTTVEAVARPVNYAQDYSRCSSRGALEGRLIAIVQARLAR